MPRISTYAFFDLETTGLPYMEKNQTKIVEFSIVAASRLDIESTAFGHTPLGSKLTFVVNPTRPIHPDVTKMTGFTNKALLHAPLFKEKIGTIKAFLEELPKPVCLVAHNGNVFDFKILLAEIQDANSCLPPDLLVVDSLVGFRKILKGTNINYEYLKDFQVNQATSTSDPEDLLTSDEDEDDYWPELSMSEKDFNEIDKICNGCDSSFDESRSVDIERSKAIRNIFKNSKLRQEETKVKETFTLSALYKRLLNKEDKNCHRAEVDCLILAECVVALKDDFLPWADEACKLLSSIIPLDRYQKARCNF